MQIVFLHTFDEKSRSSKYPKKCPLPLIVPLPQECEHVLGGFRSSKAPNSPPLAPTLIHLSYHKVGVFLCAHLHTSDEKSRSSKYPKKCPPPLIVPLSQECAPVPGGFKSFKAPNSPPLAPTLIHLSYHKVGVFLYAHRGQPCVAAWPGSPPVARAGSLTEGETNTVKS